MPSLGCNCTWLACSADPVPLRGGESAHQKGDQLHSVPQGPCGASRWGTGRVTDWYHHRCIYVRGTSLSSRSMAGGSANELLRCVTNSARESTQWAALARGGCMSLQYPLPDWWHLYRRRGWLGKLHAVKSHFVCCWCWQINDSSVIISRLSAELEQQQQQQQRQEAAASSSGGWLSALFGSSSGSGSGSGSNSARQDGAEGAAKKREEEERWRRWVDDWFVKVCHKTWCWHVA